MCTVGVGQSSDRYGGRATTRSTTTGRSTEMEELVSLASQELDRNGVGWGETGRDSRGAETLYHHSYSPYIVHQMISTENCFIHTYVPMRSLSSFIWMGALLLAIMVCPSFFSYL
jgi:hypothetical protein